MLTIKGNVTSEIKPNLNPNRVDQTLLNAQGSSLFAALVVAELRKVVPEFTP